MMLEHHLEFVDAHRDVCHRNQPVQKERTAEHIHFISTTRVKNAK
jgi:hypothetical protein